MSDGIYQKIEQIIKDVNPSLKGLRKDANLRKDLELDSLDTISFFFEVEKIFNIKIPESDIADNDLLTINMLIKYIEERINT